MKQSDVLIWLPDSMLADPDIQEAIKGFGGIFVNGENGEKLSEQYSERKNLYNFRTKPSPIDFDYLGECGTNRVKYPHLTMEEDSYTLWDESSPYRIDKTDRAFSGMSFGRGY